MRIKKGRSHADKDIDEGEIPALPAQESGEVSIEELAQLLSSQMTTAVHPASDRYDLLDRLDRHENRIVETYRQFSGPSQDEKTPSYAAEWLLDNFFVVQQTVRQVRQDLPRGYYRELPKLAHAPWANIPRSYALAHYIVQHAGGQIKPDDIILFLQVFQAHTPLTMGELWAFPTMLRLNVLRNLSGALAVLIRADPLPVNAPPLSAVDSMVRFCITGLRQLAVQDWKIFFEQVSLVEQILRQDASDVYETMDFETRNMYRKSVERIARLTGTPETRVAEQAIAFGKTEMPDSRRAHVGYYLIGDGQRLLENHFPHHVTLFHAIGRRLFAYPTAAYLGGTALLTLAFWVIFVAAGTANGSTFGQIFAAGVLAFLPAAAFAPALVNWFVTWRVGPRLLPRLDFRQGIPEQYKTMVVIPSLLNDISEIDSLIQQVELHFLRNDDDSLFFALLTDYADSTTQHTAHDAELVAYARDRIDALNGKYRPAAPPFYLFHRERQWNAAQNTWMGWERKRGKLMEFNHLLRGDETTSYAVQVGDLQVLPRIRYVITLDADTILLEGTACRLVATLAHPLNRAIYDPIKGKVVSGYSILQPRVEIKPVSANRSRFTRIFAGDAGLDLYTHASSDVYQDLFGEGSYVGKGIYDVDVLEACLANRIPENTLLSHDLFEGIHARVALASDIVLLEEYPTHYLSYTRRMHRWIRGDWQLLPWLLPRIPDSRSGKTLPNTFSMLDRWKMSDNLRRSLVSPALLLLLSAAWLGFVSQPWVWTLIAVAALGLPFFASLLTGLIHRPVSVSFGAVLHSRRIDALRWLLAVAFLPYETFVTLGAICITLVRLFVTRTGLLQWTAAAQTNRFWGADQSSEAAWSEMAAAPLWAAGSAALILIVNPAAMLFALPILILWLVSPQIAYWLSQTDTHTEPALTAHQKDDLRHLARQTWLFFEQLVGPADHWLPPDHFQETPNLTAHRTSPTNIGLLLTSTLAAHDLGYIGLFDLATRLQATFDTLDQLEHYRGHLLNWYDTTSLAALEPRYVSTVDSGNLAGCLMTVKQACLTLADAPAFNPVLWQGLLDTLWILEKSLAPLYRHGQDDAQAAALQTFIHVIRQQIQTAAQQPEQQATFLDHLNHTGWQELSRLLVAVIDVQTEALDARTLSDIRITSERVHHALTGMRRDMEMLLPWQGFIARSPTLFALADADTDNSLAAVWHDFKAVFPASPRLSELSAIYDEAIARLEALRAQLPESIAADDVQLHEANLWCAGLLAKLNEASLHVGFLRGIYEKLPEQIETRLQAMDFTFLFHTRRQVFHIGYNLTSDSLDDNFYDLLASEARLASFIAIAKRDVPQTHWLHLGRPVARVSHALTLMSWSGTMFEYLMPNLFMRTYAQTFLAQSCRSAVDGQIAYARAKQVPWGISESAYYAFDNTMTYQYRAFGVPEMGFKRGLSDDLVISPYASLLALTLRPQAVYKNMAHLDALAMRGLYGFYESVDYTPTRVPLREPYAIVQSYMAHHQGMILVSLANYLLGDTMVERFHADRRVQSFALLLQEKAQTQTTVEPLNDDESAVWEKPSPPVNMAPWQIPENVTVPQVHTLSNGRLSTLITHAGSGSIQWQGIALTPWKPDSTLDASGLWIYLQDHDRDLTWSAGYQPTTLPRDYQHVSFYPHQAEFQRRDHDITVNMQVTVAADDDVEIRRVTLINHGETPRRLRVTSYGELLMTTANERHPAFNKLFIESEYLPEHHMLLFHRRLRADEEQVYVGHLLLVDSEQRLTGAYESDRMQFIGRGRTLKSPAALDKGAALSGQAGVTLDPIMALSQDITLDPYARVSLIYLTLAARTRVEATAIARAYSDWSVTERAVELARRQNEQALRKLEMDSASLEQAQRVLALLLYPHAGLRVSPDVIRENTRGQSALWAYGVSGDVPIMLIRLGESSELPLLREVLRAHAYWHAQQIAVDVVVMNLRDSSYSQELQEQIHHSIAQARGSAALNQRGGLFVINADRMNQDDRILMETAARVILDGGRGSLAEQVAHIPPPRPSLPPLVPSLSASQTAGIPSPLPRPDDLQFDNGLGGFSADGDEYVIYLKAGQTTPAPWVNVIANAGFGFLVSESGAGYTWAGNSSENRLTPWHNDPVSDPSGEALYLRDEETTLVWSPMPYPSRDAEPYLIRHGAGYSSFEHHSQGIKQKTLLYAAVDAPVKIIRLTLENTSNRPRRITATYYAEWVLGVRRADTQMFIVPEYDHTHGALLARNPYNAEFGSGVAFLAGNKMPHGVTADRTEFLGYMGEMSRPAALSRGGLSSNIEAGNDPCAALQLHVDLPVGGSEEIFFLIGQGRDREHAVTLVHEYQNPSSAAAALAKVKAFWDDLLGNVTVHTPDAAMNLLLNRWMLYQTLACRIWGRSGFYQSSGAFGFRDQLQDVMALTSAAPKIARDHILYAARHQFEEGDVLHWWHPPGGQGVRTRFSDDLLWLPFVTAHYVRTTGDTQILDERMPFLQGEALKSGEHERYGRYTHTATEYTLYEHCTRAIQRGTTAGAHGLPLMGIGDWNDGMSRIGILGRGESVWLGWFLYSVLQQFTEICNERADVERATHYKQQAVRLQAALEAEAWDGAWYRRAYDDDGNPIGSADNLECRIDSIAQSWAVLSGAADETRASAAMSAAAQHLVRAEDRLLLLFTPPFDKTSSDPGYIKSYPPGIRENGGQYTHAALWLVWAFAEQGQGDVAGELFRLLNPILRSDTHEKSHKYKVEPYVVSADVYSVAPHVGRGGWTWYTGSASWTYRVGSEALLGLKRLNDKLVINPCIPEAWTGYEAIYRAGSSTYNIRVRNPHHVTGGVVHIQCDGETLQDGYVPLFDDGQTHDVRVELGIKK